MSESAELTFSEKDRTEEAFADAMLYAQAILVREERNRAKEILTPSELLEDATNAGCEYSTRLAATYLNTKYRDLFSGIILLKTHCYPRGELVNDWIMHQVLLVQAKDGTYYSGSPANYDKEEKINRLTRVHKTDSLEEIVSSIQREDGGTWPSPDSIRDVLSDDTKRLPDYRPGERVECTRIYIDSDKENGTFNQTVERKPIPPLQILDSQ